MLVSFSVQLACLWQLCTFAASLPTEHHQQQPLGGGHPTDFLFIQKAFQKAEIIPTVIDDFLPSLLLTITWPHHHTAHLGNTLKPGHLQSQPTVKLIDPINAHSNLSYVVTLTDPDAPSREDPKWSEMCHWIAANVSLASASDSSSVRSEEEHEFSILPLPEHGLTSPISTSASASSSSSLDDVMPYKPPGPPPKTGKHRYIFLVFAARNGTTAPLTPSKPKERQHWGTGRERGGVREWAAENGLVAVGGNFVYARNKKQ